MHSRYCRRLEETDDIRGVRESASKKTFCVAGERYLSYNFMSYLVSARSVIYQTSPVKRMGFERTLMHQYAVVSYVDCRML